MKNICVYLGANAGNNPAFRNAVIHIAHEIVDHGLTLIYGGSSLGMMGLLATTVKDFGGTAIGVITKHLLDKEKPLDTLDKLYIVDSMQERKKMLQQLSDAFIVMPGGLGTLEEAIETWNAIKIGEINKKIGFLDIDNYFEKLFEFTDHCQDNGFMNSQHCNIPVRCSDPVALLNNLVKPEPSILITEKNPVLV